VTGNFAALEALSSNGAGIKIRGNQPAVVAGFGRLSTEKPANVIASIARGPATIERVGY